MLSSALMECGLFFPESSVALEQRENVIRTCTNMNKTVKQTNCRRHEGDEQ